MRFAIAVSVLLAAGPASASWFPVFNARQTNVVVGEKTAVGVHAMWSGLVDYGGGIHWTFVSDNPLVFTAYEAVQDAYDHEIVIHGIAPGSAYICLARQDGSCSTYFVRVDVACGAEPPVRASVPHVEAHIKEAVHLLALSDFADRTTFTWYAGHAGDVSHPLNANGQQLTITPAAYGSQFVWVSAITTCSESRAEFTIDVPRLRPRAVRK